MRYSLSSVAVALLCLAAAPTVSKVVGDLRVIPVKTEAGEGAATVSKLDGSRTGYYFDLGERAGQLRPAARRVVLLGLGGGEMLRAARRSLPKADLLGIDNDPRMIRAAVDEFHIGAFGARAELGDAFVYVKKLRGADVLLVDLFVGDAMPPATGTAQFWRDCRAAITAGGLVVVNVYPAHLVGPVEQLWREVGLRVLEQHEVHGSTVVFGSL